MNNLFWGKGHKLLSSTKNTHRKLCLDKELLPATKAGGQRMQRYTEAGRDVVGHDNIQ